MFVDSLKKPLGEAAELLGGALRLVEEAPVFFSEAPHFFFEGKTPPGFPRKPGFQLRNVVTELFLSLSANKKVISSNQV